MVKDHGQYEAWTRVSCLGLRRTQC